MEQGVYVGLVDEDEDDVQILNYSFRDLGLDAFPIRNFTDTGELINTIENEDAFPCLLVIESNSFSEDSIKKIQDMVSKKISAAPNTIILFNHFDIDLNNLYRHLRLQIINKPGNLEQWKKFADFIVKHCELTLSHARV